MRKLYRLLFSCILCVLLMIMSACGTPSEPAGDEVSSESEVETIQEFDVYDVEMIEVDSSCFCEIGYDTNWEKLVVRFRENSDPLYVYTDVSEETYEELMSSESKGGYYNQYIKGCYDCEKYE